MKTILTVKQVAELLQVSIPQVRRMIANGELSAMKVGREWRVPKAALEELFERERHFTKADMERQLRLAEVNHCLSFEQVSDELIEDYNISDGTFDTVVECRYTVPSFTSIGRLYQGVVLSTMKNDDAAQAILDVFSFFISDEISDFNSNVYYTNPDYIRYCYLEGEMLA